MPEQIIWMWNKRPVPLENLDEKQLYSIKSSVEKSNNKVWFGHSSDAILKEIDNSLRYQQQVYKLIRSMRINKATKSADVIFKMYDKAYEKLLT